MKVGVVIKEFTVILLSVVEIVRAKAFCILICTTLAALLYTWVFLQRVSPNFTILEDPPQVVLEKVKFLCDDNMSFRVNSMYLQNAGDTFGRTTGLREYDYSKVYKWLKFLESFDGVSNYTPALASYYFGVTDVIDDLPYIMQFLEENYHKSPNTKWWWLYIAVHIANYKLHNYDKALQLAYLLSSTENERMPKWAREMPAFILEKRGELEEALQVIKDLAENYNDFAQTEINFMNYFIKERLGFAEEEIKKHSVYKDTSAVY